MKTTLKEFRKLVQKEFKNMLSEGDVDSERRRNYGYDEVDSGQGVEYHDLPESLEVEDRDRLRRAADGYGETEFEEADLKEQDPEAMFSDVGPFPPGRKLPKKIGGSPVKAPGAVTQRAQQTGKAAHTSAKTISQQANTIYTALMELPGVEDPAVWKMVKNLAVKHSKGSPLATMTPGTAQGAPKEVNDPPGDEDEKKKSVAKSHAAERGHKAEVPFGEGFDATSGRDPKKTEPFDKALDLPIHNMSHSEEVPLVDIDVEIEEESVKLPGLSELGEGDLPCPSKAKKMLKDKEVHGKPLTKKQKGLFGMIAGGEKPTKMKK